MTYLPTYLSHPRWSQHVRSTDLEGKEELADLAQDDEHAKPMPEDFNSVSVVINKMGLKGYVPSDKSLTASYDVAHAVEELAARDINGLGRGPLGIGSNPALDKALFRADAHQLTLGVDVLQKRRRKGVAAAVSWMAPIVLARRSVATDACAQTFRSRGGAQRRVCALAVVQFPLLCYAVLCYAMLCYAMLCYTALSCTMLCYAILCYAMLCYRL